MGGPLAYLLLLNGFLNSGVIPGLLSRQPLSLQVRWSFAWSLWPGEAHVRGFYLRSQDPGTQFEVTIDRATTAVEVTALLERRFQTRWVRASGVDFRIRPRLARDEDATALGELFPPIEGFADALMAEHPEEEPDPHAEEPWSVQLENVTVAGLREVWVGPYRGALDADVRGRLWLKPDHSLSIGPATASIRQGSVFQGPLATASGLAGSVGCTVNFQDVRVDEGAAVWKSVTWKIDVQGRLDSLGFLAHHLGRVPGLGIRGGRARLEVAASAELGRLLSGSRLELIGEEAVVELGRHRLRGAWSARGGVAPQDGKLLSTLEVSVRPVHLENLAGDTLFQSTGVTASLTASDLVLGEVPEDGKLSLGLTPSAPFPLRLLNPFVGGDRFMIDSGTATVAAKLSTGGAGKSGWLAMKTGPTQVRVGRSRIRGEAVIDLDLAKLRFDRGSFALSGSSAAFSNVEIISSRARPRGWSGKLTLDSARLELRPRLSGSAEVSGVFSDALPFLALFGDMAGLPRWATPLLEAAGLRVSGSMSFTGSTLLLRDLEATGEGLQIWGQLDVTAADVSGVFLLKVQGFTLGLELAQAAVTSQLQDPDVWYAKQRVALNR